MTSGATRSLQKTLCSISGPFPLQGKVGRRITEPVTIGVATFTLVYQVAAWGGGGSHPIQCVRYAHRNAHRSPHIEHTGQPWRTTERGGVSISSAKSAARNSPRVRQGIGD